MITAPTLAAMMVARNRMEAVMVTCQRHTSMKGDIGVTWPLGWMT